MFNQFGLKKRAKVKKDSLVPATQRLADNAQSFAENAAKLAGAYVKTTEDRARIERDRAIMENKIRSRENEMKERSAAREHRITIYQQMQRGSDRRQQREDGYGYLGYSVALVTFCALAYLLYMQNKIALDSSSNKSRPSP